MKSKDFEKEFCNYFNNFKDTPESNTWLDMYQARRFARHFMKWQKEQTIEFIHNYQEIVSKCLQQSIDNGEQGEATYWDGAQDATITIERGIKEDEK